DDTSSAIDSMPGSRQAEPESWLEREDMNQKLADWLQNLPDRQTAIIIQRFGLMGHESGTLDEVGREVGLTRERVRQLQIEALAKLRRLLEREGISKDILREYE